MVQTDFQQNYKRSILLSNHHSDEAINLTTTFADVLIIDKRGMRKVVVVIEGHATLIVEYRVFGTPELVELDDSGFDEGFDSAISGTPPPSSNDSWFNLLNLDCDPSAYDHDKIATIIAAATELKSRLSISEPHSFVRIQARVTVGTGTIMMWSRAQN